MPVSPEPSLHIIAIEDRGDARGPFYFAPKDAIEFLGEVRDMRAGVSKPGVLRGNNFNLASRQAIVVIHESEWTLHWDCGESTAVRHRRFEGAGAETILVDAGCARAIQNSGDKGLVLIELSNRPFAASDVKRRTVCEPQ